MLGLSMQLHVVASRTPSEPPTNPTAWNASTPTALFSPILIAINVKPYTGPTVSRLRHKDSFFAATVGAAAEVGFSALSRIVSEAGNAASSGRKAGSAEAGGSGEAGGSAPFKKAASETDVNVTDSVAKSVTEAAGNLAKCVPVPPTWYKPGQKLSGATPQANKSDHQEEVVDSEEQLWRLAGNSLENVYQMLFRVCRAAGGATGPPKHAESSVDCLPTRVWLSRVSIIKENAPVNCSASTTTPTVVDFLEGLDAFSRAKVHVRSPHSSPSNAPRQRRTLCCAQLWQC